MVAFRLRYLGREVTLPDAGTLRIGRGDACEISIDDPLVSRLHATFITDQSKLEVVDHGGMNGTTVNGVPVVGSLALAHRDRVRMGSHVFVVLGGHDVRSQSSETLLKRPGGAITRRVHAAVRPGGGLDGIERALQEGQVPVAAQAMTAILGADGDVAKGLDDSELPRLSRLLLSLSELTGEQRFFAQMLELYASRELVPDATLIAAIRTALPALPADAAAAIDQYLDWMQERASSLPVQEQVRLRLVSALARKAPGGALG